MKRKWVFAFALLLVIVPCFAEIRVDRAGYTDEVGNSVNVAIYWNDKYSYLKISAKEKQKQIAGFLQRNRGENVHIIDHYYTISDGTYVVDFIYGSTFFDVMAGFSYFADGYRQTLYQNSFYSFNDAKAQFDFLCQRYYNEIPR